MTYYCIYKNECSHKECTYRQTKSKFSVSTAKKDLTINEFICNRTGKKGTRLISDERIICDRYRECSTVCFLKTIYITINNFKKIVGYEFKPLKPFRCPDTEHLVNLQLAGENIGSYISIWNQPNLFNKETVDQPFHKPYSFANVRKIKWV